MRRLAIGTLLIVLLAAGAARATVIRRLSLDRVIGDAQEVFVGTVRMTSAVEGGEPRNLIWTDVTFENLEVLKGRIPHATATYRFAGGRIGERRTRVVGVPEFAADERCVLFMTDRDLLSPAVGWHQGVYRVVRDAKTGDDRIRTCAGKPVYDFEDGQPVLEPAEKGDRAMTLAAFRLLVEKTIARQAHAEDGSPGTEEPEDPGDGPQPGGVK